MSSPFLSFDPFFFSKDFLFFGSLICFIIFPVFFHKNLFSFFMKTLELNILNLFPKSPFFTSGFWGFLFSIFLVFSFMNLMSLWAYIFTPTAHLLLSFSLGMMIWMSTFFIQIFSFFFRKMEHFAPQGTPLWLLPLMVLIEIISQLIRPITLSVRLAANLTAGHLILSLLSSLSTLQSLFFQIPLIVLEVLVALVQPFVFCMLLFLYFSES